MSIAIPILMYHQVTPRIHPKFLPYSVTPQTFKIHMKILEFFRFSPINLTQLLDYRNGKTSLPKKPVIITFDDCYQECVDHAVPILLEKGFTAVFYMPTDYAGKDSHWIVPELGIEFPIISWKTLKHLDSCGFQIGSHSMSHPHLSKINPEACFKELYGSRKILEERLDHEVTHLAYPYGSFNECVRAIAAEAGYFTACTTEELFSSPLDDLLLLPRMDVLGYMSNLDFILKLHIQGSFNTTLAWLEYTHGKIRGIRRRIRRIREKFMASD